MILADTSVWVGHLRAGDAHMRALLEQAEVACHPFVIAELACGHLRKRKEILALLQELPATPAIDLEEFREFVDGNRLAGMGIGFVDVHLLASAKLAGLLLWTTDRPLRAASQRLGLNYQ